VKYRSELVALLLGFSAFHLALGAMALQSIPEPPSIEFGALYEAVEMAGVFPDQKTFADALPEEPPAQIMADYDKQKGRPGFDLKTFVHQHFAEPPRKSVNFKQKAEESVANYIVDMWDVLLRKPDEAEPYSSLLVLSHPYVVPGGRFSEIYYWDSYFTMLGLEQDDRHDLARDMLENMGSLIDRYGHIPNGNRSYYLSRSQPPFFSSMVELIAAHDGEAVYRKYLPELRAEYDYWMDGADNLASDSAHRHLIRLSDGTLLNRYWDDRDTPRDESYREDVETAKHADRPASEVYRDLRAGGESGWDFSSRWLADGVHLWTIRTTAIAPVDLNTLIAHLEQVLAKAYQLANDTANAQVFEQRADKRIAAIRRLMWNAKIGLFTDYLWQEGKQSDVVSAATVFPLYFGAATPEQAHAVAAALTHGLLGPGGLGTTLSQSGQQWDRPNGWAPMQYLAIEGLKAYGKNDLASEIANRWIKNDIEAYEKSGVLMEKYNVEQSLGQSNASGGAGGEYPLQVGFGWTNGVLSKLMAEFPEQSSEALRQYPRAR
jgi:alpha,alpha-trehalase